MKQEIQKHSGETGANKTESAETPRVKFFDAIGRPDLNDEKIITPKTPIAYFTMEMYRHDISGGGGLGVLASDIAETAKKLKIPMTFFTPLYPIKTQQKIEKFKQVITETVKNPEELGFDKINEVTIKTINNGAITPTSLGIYKKQEGCVNLVGPYEPNLGKLYQGEPDSDHRFWQEDVLGIGGHAAAQKMGIEPPVYLLNEAPTVFSALAELDTLTTKTGSVAEALAMLRAKTIYTNHTLVQAVEAEFSRDQFERFVIPNLANESVRQWVRKKFEDKGEKLKLSLFGIELSGIRNGVSSLHAREAGKVYKDFEGNPIAFEGVTNGIALERWGDPELLALYENNGIIDTYGLPADDYKEKIDRLDRAKLELINQRGRRQLREHLKTREDQYGGPMIIPPEAKVFSWRRRIAGYKRPEMMFAKPEELARLLEEENAHIVMAGRAHPKDDPMQDTLTEIFRIIDQNPILRARVHFVQNYDEELSRALAQGADASLNTPRVRNEQGERISTEASGTSGMKDALGNTLLISTEDGWFADARIRAEAAGTRDFKPPYLEITGDTYREEVTSLYAKMREASRIISEGRRMETALEQLKEYLPIISGTRMIKDYLNMAFPKKSEKSQPHS